MVNRATPVDKSIVHNPQTWPGETLCLKRYGVGQYLGFGVILNSEEPVTIYLRGDHPGEDFKLTKQYPTFDDMFNDGWVVD